MYRTREIISRGQDRSRGADSHTFLRFLEDLNFLPPTRSNRKVSLGANERVQLSARANMVKHEQSMRRGDGPAIVADSCVFTQSRAFLFLFLFFSFPFRSFYCRIQERRGAAKPHVAALGRLRSQGERRFPSCLTFRRSSRRNRTADVENSFARCFRFRWSTIERQHQMRIASTRCKFAFVQS